VLVKCISLPLSQSEAGDNTRAHARNMLPAMTVNKRKLDELEADKIEESIEEERVLSHAAQRRLRKRLKTSHGEEPPKKTVSEPFHSSVDKHEVQTHTIWVGNLAYKTTPQDLRVFFADVSEDIKRIHMPTKALHGSRLVRNGKAHGDNKGCVSRYPFGIRSGCDDSIDSPTLILPLWRRNGPPSQNQNLT
jgi:hypothetical protein